MALLQNVIMRGTHASRPSAASQGLLYFETDTGQLFRDSGSAWQLDDTTLLYTAKGQMLASSASAGVGALAAGTDGYVLTADSAQTLGVKWAAAGSTSVTTKGDLQGYDTAAGRVPVGSNGQILTADSTQALGLKWAAAGTSALTQLAQTVLGSAAANITFSSISGSYSSLQLVIDARGDTSATTTSLYVQFNTDTASNYDYEWADANGSSVPGVEGIAQAQIRIGGIPAATAPASVSGLCDVLLANYAGTTFHKSLRFMNSNKVANSSTSAQAYMGCGWWRSTAAITSIKIYPAAGNFVTGSVATLYGIS